MGLEPRFPRVRVLSASRTDFVTPTQSMMASKVNPCFWPRTEVPV